MHKSQRTRAVFNFLFGQRKRNYLIVPWRRYDQIIRFSHLETEKAKTEYWNSFNFLFRERETEKGNENFNSILCFSKEKLKIKICKNSKTEKWTVFLFSRFYIFHSWIKILKNDRFSVLKIENRINFHSIFRFCFFRFESEKRII